jgi:transposase InsO family protein
MAKAAGINWNSVQPPIFSGENYEFWSIKMKTLFTSLELWDMVETEFEDPESTENFTVAQMKEFKEKRSKDAGALGLIQRGVADSIFPRIMRASKAKQAWEILQQEFQGDEKVRSVKLQNLRRDLENMRMKDDETIDEFSSRFVEVVNQMKSYGEEIKDKKIVEKVLISLTEKFDPIVAVIEETKDFSKLSVQELMGSLKAYEQRLARRSEKSIESAFQSKLNLGSKNQDKEITSSEKQNFQSFRGGRHGRGRGRGRSGSFRGRGRGNDENRGSCDSKSNDASTSRRCYHCDRAGHIAKDCWFMGKTQCFKCKKFGHVQKDCRVQSSQQVNFMEDKGSEENLFYACQNSMEERNDVWYLDSGCSNHMTAKKEIFLNMDSSFNSRVRMGNGEMVEVKGKGSIGVQTKKGRKVMHDVLFVPDLNQNLLSLGQLLEHGYSLHFRGRGCTIYDQTNKNVVEIKMGQHRSFPLTFKYAKQVALRADLVDDSWLWHRRFGHLNFQSLKLLQQQDLVYGLPSIHEKGDVCEGCALGKHHRQPFPKGGAWRAKEVLELVHTDVCGPMKTLSNSQNKYFILFIDDYSRMTWVYFMRQRSEVFSIFKKFKALVEKQSGHSIKVLRSDRGKEYTSSKFEKFCEEEGVERQLTVGYTPQQNGVSERKNQTVMEMAKCMLFEKGIPSSFWAEAVNTAVYLINRSPTKALKNETPFEAWSGRKPSVNHLKVFGCLCYAQIPKERRHKLEETSERCIFLGYSSMSKGYKLCTI